MRNHTWGQVQSVLSCTGNHCSTFPRGNRHQNANLHSDASLSGVRLCLRRSEKKGRSRPLGHGLLSIKGSPFIMWLGFMLQPGDNTQRGTGLPRSPNVPRVSPNHNPTDVNVPLYGHTALRWAFGVNMRASELGWFPMNYLAASTRALMTV